MPLALTALLARTKAQFAAETDPAKRVALSQDIAAFERTMKKSEEDDDEEDDDEDEKKSKKSKKASAAKKAEEAAAAKKAEEEAAAAKGNETDRKEKKMEEEEAAALADIGRVAIAMTGATSADAMRGKLKAIADKAAEYDTLAERVEAIEQAKRADTKASLIQAALHHPRGPRITTADAKWLEGQKLAVVESFLSEHTKAIVNIDGEELRPTGDARLSGGATGDVDLSAAGALEGESQLDAATIKQINLAVAHGGNRKSLVATHVARLSMNGKARS